jgi:hypothetical protein
MLTPRISDRREDDALHVERADHFLPLLYVLAQHDGDEPISFPV